ncbi:MAG: hypothetical protein AB1405_05460 [Bdellovibrionota bacterium]
MDSNAPHPTYLKLKAFLEGKPVCARASEPMKPGACVRILFHDHQDVYSFRRTPLGPRLEPIPPEKPDFTLRLTTALVERLAELESEDIGEFGVLLISLGASPDLNFRINAAIHTGFRDLWRKGYFGILRLGGWRVMRAMAAKGLTNIGVIREKVNKNVKPA